jgi:hypothetical protein
MLQKISPVTQVRVYATIQSTTGTLIDPTNLTFTLTDPSQNATVSTYGIDSFPVRQSTGMFYVDATVTMTGVYKYAWQATGNVIASFSGNFISQS